MACSGHQVKLFSKMAGVLPIWIVKFNYVWTFRNHIILFRRFNGKVQQCICIQAYTNCKHFSS